MQELILLVQVEGVATIAADDGLVHEGKSYCFAGKTTWQSLVQQGKVLELKAPSFSSPLRAAYRGRCSRSTAISLLLAAEALQPFCYGEV